MREFYLVSFLFFFSFVWSSIFSQMMFYLCLLAQTTSSQKQTSITVEDSLLNFFSINYLLALYCKSFGIEHLFIYTGISITRLLREKVLYCRCMKQTFVITKQYSFLHPLIVYYMWYPVQSIFCFFIGFQGIEHFKSRFKYSLGVTVVYYKVNVKKKNQKKTKNSNLTWLLVQLQFR